MLTIFHIFLNCFLILSALFLFLSENSVHSILFLVLTFLNASAICFVFGADFLGLLLVIIYVGAIAVLFLFVVMMLNVKVQILGLAKYLPLIVLVILIVFNQILNFTGDVLLNFNFLEFNYKHFESMSNDFFLSQTLFNYFLLCFLLSGIILLVGMIGAIVLTLNFNTKNRQEQPFRQLSRADQVLSFFK
jgi:NADH-quinone oxidoreductase subunit J